VFTTVLERLQDPETMHLDLERIASAAEQLWQIRDERRVLDNSKGRGEALRTRNRRKWDSSLSMKVQENET